jgi:cyclic beta-1,2-glucan synthetase
LETGALIGYFAKRDEARRAFKQLQRRGYRRAALMSKTADGSVHTHDPFRWRRPIGAIAAFILFGALVGTASMSLHWPGPAPGGVPAAPVHGLLGGLVGILLSAAWIRRSRYGVERKLLKDYARWLLFEETVLILQTPIETFRYAVTVLRESGEIPPAIFVLHPKRETLLGEVESLGPPLPTAQIREHAERIAGGQRVDPSPRRSIELLERLERTRTWIHLACLDLSEASRLGQNTPPTVEWLLDNEYIIDSNAREALTNLPRRYYQKLPTLINEAYRGLPRIYGLARELVSHSDLRLDRENILAFIEAYQSISSLSIGELWAVPQMLRAALIESILSIAERALTELHEHEVADFWANRLIAANRRDPNQLFSILAELAETQPVPSIQFVSQLIDSLYDQEAVLVPVRAWLARTFKKSLTELSLPGQDRQTKDQISIGNALTSLRQLALLDWRKLFEELSRVELLLRLDPSGVYPLMDFESRDRYRRSVEELARRSGQTEEQVARQVIELASRAARAAAKDERQTHIGTYLIGDGRGELARLLRCREAFRFRAVQWICRHHSAVYFSALGFFTAAFIALIALLGLGGQTLEIRLLIVLLLLIPTTQLSLEVVNYLVTRSLPPRVLPKMDYQKSGIPDDCRTLVVVPMLLVDGEAVRNEVHKLEIRYLANREDNLLFGLFSDYTDSKQAHDEEDEHLLQAAVEGIGALNHRYGGERFFLFHRERTWSESEQAFIGWERKRGKLEELNGLLDGTRPEEADRLVHVGDPRHLSDVRFVITLDSDTQLPHDTARRLIETIAHPLNQPRFDYEGTILAGSYAIIQPRVSPSLPSTNATPFSRLFSDPVGIDPYTRAVSDVNQDLSGEGSYHGKGIYDVRSFSRVLSGTFPEETLLSHDLIEGAHVRVGLASDIELYDEFPHNYQSYAGRQHRWIRGDWQIADWILPRVPAPGGRRGPNPLSWFDRWKVFDNLRRSLIPATSLALLIASWLISSRMVWISAIVVATQMLFHPLVQPFTWVTTSKGLKGVSLSKVAHDLLRAIVEAALLPHQAWLALDAILRVWYRRLISHRRLLEWASAQAMHGNTPGRARTFVLLLGLVSVFSVIVGWVVRRWMPANLFAAGPWLALWFLSPLIGWLLTLQPLSRPQQFLLPEKDIRFLRTVARRTWRYFSDFVGDDTSWLPPDNYQVSHKNQLAMRTSPTNIGLWLVSAIGAHDFGYLTADQVVDGLTHTMETIRKLERHEGHLLNWYDIQTLAPLEPRYVSMVDSGNLLGALWTLESGIDEMVRSPLFDAKVFAGLRDTGELLRRTAEEEGASGFDSRGFDELRRAWEDPPARIDDALRLLRRMETGARVIAEGERGTAGGKAGTAYWATQLEQQITSWLGIADRYLGWIELLGEKTETEIARLGLDAPLACREALHHAPSLLDLARGDIGCIRTLRSIREEAPSGEAPLFEWIDRLMGAFERSKWLAGEMLAASERLAEDGRELSNSINMRFLYDSERRLFSIGYNVSEGRPDSSYYDLLASEARLGSFIAIARGDISVEHWFSLSRPYGSIGRRRVLLSWAGTMFEYLMPLIFQRSYGNSLLDKATKDAVAIHIAYGRTRHVPWGISESAFGDMDINKTYQYKAFGVPELGLKRGLEEQVVVAPYASLLALSIAPRETAQNLRRLARMGLLKDYGYYEAIDFTRPPNREGKRGVIVRAYMTHHQGMAFLSLANLVHGNAIQRRFHADARVRAVEPLLHERIPVLSPLHHISTRERVPSVMDVGEVAPAESKVDTPHTATPKTQLLSNGRYRLMLTNAGGGYSRWGDHEITRWRSDRTRDSWGTFCYIHDVDSNEVWSNTFHPTGGKVEGYTANFALDRAVFRRAYSGIQTETEVIVSPEDDVEIRRIALFNRSIRTRHLELTSYVELAMAPHDTDRQHPAFNKLFIQTEAVSEHQALIAYRRSRGEDGSSLYVAHRFTLETGDDEPLRFETDRRQFIGRGRTLAGPMGILQEPGNTQGFVLDPILSMRRSVTLAPGQRVRVSLVIAAGETRRHVLGLMDKYGEPPAIDRAMDFAWASSQLELRLLRIHADEARRFQQLASHLLFPNPRLRSAPECIEENCKGQAGLWPYGISGDAPIAMVTIGEAQDITIVRQMLQAHAYWRNHGFKADLVILNEEAGGYEQPLRERLERLIQTHSVHTGTDKTDGIYLLGADHMPAEDLTLLRAAASVVLAAARGTMPRQLGVPAEVPELPEPMHKKRAPRVPSPSLPFLELPYFNSLGGFTQDGREYAIYLGPDIHTPAPWVNVIANPSFGTMLSETGSGFTWYGNSQRNRLTHWSNDPVTDPPSEAVYIRDEETGVYWTPTASPVREKTPYRARHGAGYTVFEHNSNGIEQELVVFVPVDKTGGAPIKLQRLRLRNDSSERRTLSVTYYAEWTLGEDRESSQMHVVTQWDEGIQTLIARNAYHPEYGNRVAFAAISPPADSYSGDRTSFLGRNRSMRNPAAMERVRLSRRMGAGLDPCAALQARIELAPGERTEITCMLGQAGSMDEVRELVRTYRESRAFEGALDHTKRWWDGVLGAIEVHTPELATDFLVNRWLLYQDLSCRIWGRTAFYQSSGAFGFRDQLQDVMAFVYAYPELAREHILAAASRQFNEGDVQHWWHPPNGAGIRSRISDDLLWLPYVVAHYVRITGDVDILHAMVPFLHAPVLEDNQRESFSVPEIAKERATLFEHCRRAVARGLTIGPTGLPLMGTGDWNDGMNLVGAGGKGQSVWLAWFLADVLQGIAEMSDALDRADLSLAYRRDRNALIRRTEHAAWDGQWYLRATFDDGSLLGSSANREAKIDSLPQSWAWLSGAAGADRAGKALESAWTHLVREDEGLVLLLEPPFDTSEPSPGYIRGYPPGVRENGGQYTHAALWLSMAMARSGDGERAAKILRLLNPIEHARDPESVWRYEIEPYVIAADVYRLPGRIGHGGWSWYTGAAAWMYRAWVEEVLGLQVRGDRLQLNPVIPGWWDGFSIRYRHGEALYEIRVENPDRRERGVEWVELDGQRLPGGVIPLEWALVKHRILVHMGEPLKAADDPPHPTSAD